jgi:hypothetical protein
MEVELTHVVKFSRGYQVVIKVKENSFLLNLMLSDLKWIVVIVNRSVCNLERMVSKKADQNAENGI